MTDDRMEQITADVARRYAVFDAKRKTLIAAYDKARTPKGKLRALAKAVRHHHSYMEHSLFGGWYVDSLKNFADAIDWVADEL